MIGILVVIIIGSVYCESNGCPAPELIKPCYCQENVFGIKCGGQSDIDLVKIFQTLEKNLTKSEKHFYSFDFVNNSITELKENTFKRITFDVLMIAKCENLSKIHINAFVGTSLVTKQLWLMSNPALSSSDNSIFEVISKFVNLELLEFTDNNITEIPSNAFHRTVGYQDKFKDLRIGGKSIKKIGSRAFASLKELKSLLIYNTSIDYIPEHAFEFEEESDQPMDLKFKNNAFLSSSSFHQDSLVNFKRPVFLNIGYNRNQFEYLDENVFRNFLTSNHQNRIEMLEVQFDCNNCKNLWLRNQPNLLERVIHLTCSNHKNINDTENFVDCAPYSSIKPCKFMANDQAIFCGGNTDIDLKAMFHNFSKQLSDNEKHFKKFYLSNTYIKVLEENTFDEITFDEIYINYCSNLTNIARHAFTATDLVTKEFVLQKNNKLSMDKTIYTILSSFMNIESITLSDIGFNEIPSNAFRPLIGYQKYLRELEITQTFTKIGSHSFSNLKNLTQLTLDIKDLHSIPDYAFVFEEYSDQLFRIDFYQSSNFSAFNGKTLLNIRRPTELKIFGESTYLEEKVFLPFLLDNEKNAIQLPFFEAFDCNDCRNYWLKKNQTIRKRIYVICQNGKQLNDPDNFKNCIL